MFPGGKSEEFLTIVHQAIIFKSLNPRMPYIQDAAVQVINKWSWKLHDWRMENATCQWLNAFWPHARLIQFLAMPLDQN